MAWTGSAWVQLSYSPYPVRHPGADPGTWCPRSPGSPTPPPGQPWPCCPSSQGCPTPNNRNWWVPMGITRESEYYPLTTFWLVLTSHGYSWRPYPPFSLSHYFLILLPYFYYIIALLLLLLYCSIWNKVRHRPWFKKAVRITANISLWRQGIGISVLHPLPFGIASNEDSQDCLHSPCCLACNSWGQTKGWWHFSHILRWRYFWIKESVRSARRRGQTRVAAQQKSTRFHGPFYP